MKENYIEIIHNHPVLEADRIRLRQFTQEDAEDVYEYASDEQTVRYLNWEGISTMEQAHNIIDNFYAEDGIYAIELKESRRCIGCISFKVIPEHEKADFGYVLKRKYWNQGYMTEALKVIIQFGFDELELNRFEAIHYAGNEGSGKVMAKCGLIKEGYGVSELKVKGSFRDVIHYGITKEQWKKLQK